jgi:hypothetical protein
MNKHLSPLLWSSVLYLMSGIVLALSPPSTIHPTTKQLRTTTPAYARVPSIPNIAAKKGFVLMGLVVEQATMDDLASTFDAFQVQMNGGEHDKLSVSACYQAQDGAYLEFDTAENDATGLKMMLLDALTK